MPLQLDFGYRYRFKRWLLFGSCLQGIGSLRHGPWKRVAQTSLDNQSTLPTLFGYRSFWTSLGCGSSFQAPIFRCAVSHFRSRFMRSQEPYCLFVDSLGMSLKLHACKTKWAFLERSGHCLYLFSNLRHLCSYARLSMPRLLLWPFAFPTWDVLLCLQASLSETLLTLWVPHILFLWPSGHLKPLD